MTHHWKVQQVTPITSHDTAGSSLLLGCANGKIYYIGGCSVLLILCVECEQYYVMRLSGV